MLVSIIGKLLSMFGTTWECESVFSMAKLMESKYTSSISDENPVSECDISVKHTLGLEDFI